MVLSVNRPDVLTWIDSTDGAGMMLRKRSVVIAHVCPDENGVTWKVHLDVHHMVDAPFFLARSKQQAMNVADMWAAKEGERLDREVGLVVNTGPHRFDASKLG